MPKGKGKNKNKATEQGQGKPQQQVPQQESSQQGYSQPQGAWGRPGPAGGDQRPPQERQQPQPQPQGAWGRPATAGGDQQGPPQGRQQPQPQPQGAWGRPGPAGGDQQGPPQGRQQPQPQPQGAWKRPAPAGGDQQRPPQERQQPQPHPQGAWGRPGPAGGDQRPPQERQQPQPHPQGAWKRPAPAGGDQQRPPQERQQPQPQPQGAWGRPATAGGDQQGPPQGRQQPQPQPQGAWGRPATAGGDHQRPPQERQQPQPQPQGAWGRPGPAGGDQQGPPQGRQQPQPQPQGAWGRPAPAGGDQQRPSPEEKSSPSKQKPHGSNVSSRSSSSSEAGSKRDYDQSLIFPQRIRAQKMSGTPIVVATNFFRIVINKPDTVFYHYDVVIEPEKPKFLLRNVWNTFARKLFPNKVIAFDGTRNAYSNGPIGNVDTYTDSVSVLDPENNKMREFNVSMNKVSQGNLNALVKYTERKSALPEREISVLEIIMKNFSSDRYVVSGKCYFLPSTMSSESFKLSQKLDLKFGYFQSVVLGYSPYLNFDIAHRAFYRSGHVLDVLDCFMGMHSNKIDEPVFNSFMRTVKIAYELPNKPETRRVFRVNKLMDSANRQTFTKDDGSKMTVAQYFEREKNCRLKHPDLPVLWVGPTQKSIYVPMEFCKILPDQVYKGQMDSWETREMVKNSTANASVRNRKIMTTFRQVNINKHPLLKEFNLSVSNDMEKVPARILAPPELKTSQPIRVNEGVWRIKDFLEPVTLDKWCILNTDNRVSSEALNNLQNMIKSKGRNFNMRIGDPRRNPMFVNVPDLKRTFSQLKDMDMVFVIISEAKGLYSKVKTICETQEGILTQCVKSKTVSQDPRKLSTTVDNIFLKVNAKLGGKNHGLNNNSVPECLKGYVMIVGADVTHASPGTKIPSVAAVAVSCDPTAFQYSITTRVQPKGEIIRDLQEIIAIHLKRFYELRKRYPEKIFFFRDGVSEGELAKVFCTELQAVKNACYKCCQPKITFLIVQKRHHARFFPTRREDEQGKNFNVPVGTCVDSEIVHPTNLDFYLMSHASILGTGRPTRYRLLHDDNTFTDDELEKLTYYLCHLFARCNRSISYPSPTYNAHLAAFRARAYLEGLNVTDCQDLDSVQRRMTDVISKTSPMFFV